MRKIVILLLLFFLTACAKQALEIPKTQGEVVLDKKEELALKETLGKNVTKNDKSHLEELQGLKSLTPHDVSPDMIAKAQTSLSDITEEKSVLAKKIYFSFDSYELNEDAKGVLQEISKYLNEYKSLKIVIEGHCDERGTREYNLALGMKRAEVAKKYLVDLGIASDRIEIVSYGKDRPAVNGTGEEVWSKNRRDQFKRIQ